MDRATSSKHDRNCAHVRVPCWVPEGALHYLAHTELGQPIRALARRAGVHASTILRQIRRIETRRDDPLFDAALRNLGAIHQPVRPDRPAQKTKEMAPMPRSNTVALPDEDTLARESLRILRRLCESGAVLAVAAEMQKAVVVRDTAGGSSARTAVVDAAVAQAMALKDWIAPANTGRIVRYHITAAGRTELERLLRTEGGAGAAPGFADAQTPFAPAQGDWIDGKPHAEVETTARRMRYALAESPLAALARRRDKAGAPFLEDALVHAGERLREDFELAQMGTQMGQNWDRFLTPGVQGGKHGDPARATGPSASRARVAAALRELGPGLSDVVLRCCCYLEGLETTEKRLGWSARSGKIVLRIALMRLRRHYDETTGPGGAMIG